MKVWFILGEKRSEVVASQEVAETSLKNSHPPEHWTVESYNNGRRWVFTLKNVEWLVRSFEIVPIDVSSEPVDCSDGIVR